LQGHGYRWAFLAGMALYRADMIALIVTFSLLSVGVHRFFVLKWFQGQKALKDLKDATATVGPVTQERKIHTHSSAT
jgi:hypothetical protein